MSVEVTPFTDALRAYCHDLFWQDDALLTEMTETLVREDKIRYQVSPEQGQLLQMLVKLSDARRVVEVGTLYGYSAIYMARGFVGEGHVDTIEILPEHALTAEGWLRRAGVADHVTVHRGDGVEVLRSLAGPYDLAFFDGQKSEYPQYLDEALRIVRPGGLIVADNVFWGGAVIDPSVDDDDTRGIREFNRRIASDSRLISTIVPVGDGMSLSIVA